MTQELIYTSAPKGLQLGSRGFCTVACTAGMAKPLADRLEALSGYKHLYPPGSESAHLNPVNYSFVTFKLGGKTYYVLSRIADAGLDYTQRSNKLAHHVVLEGSELPPAGPPWLMQQPGFFVTSWEGEPRPIESRRLPLGPDAGSRKCDVWQSVTGDAGWGGVLAGNHEISGSMEANIVFTPPGEKLLALVDEAQSLLQPSKRWGATFSTYYSRLPPGIECHWRFLPHGTPEAVAARRSHGILLVDLLAPKQVQQETGAIATARTGKAPALSPDRQASSTKPAAPSHHSTIDVHQKPEANLSELHNDIAVESTSPPSIPRVPKLPTVALPSQSFTVTSKSKNPAYIGVIVAASVAVVGIGYGLYITVKNPIRIADRTEIADLPPKQLKPEAAVPQPQTVNEPKENGEAKEVSAGGGESEILPGEHQPIPPEPLPALPIGDSTDDKHPQSGVPDDSDPASSNTPRNAPAETHNEALSDIVPSVTLPMIVRSAMSKGHVTEAYIGSIAANSPQIQLTLIGLSPDTTLAIHPKTSSNWDIVARASSSSESTSVLIARVIASKDDVSSDEKLRFSWNGTSATSDNFKELCNAGLLINIPDWMTRTTCAFKAPDSKEPVGTAAIPLAQLMARLRSCSDIISTRPLHQGITLKSKFSGLPGIDPLAVHSTQMEPGNASSKSIEVNFGPDKAWVLELSLSRRKQNSLNCGFSIAGIRNSSPNDWGQFERDFKSKLREFKLNARAILSRLRWTEGAQRQDALDEFDRQANAGIANFESVWTAATTNSGPAAASAQGDSLAVHKESLASLSALFDKIHAWQMDKDSLERNFALHLNARAELLSHESTAYFTELFKCGEF